MPVRLRAVTSKCGLVGNVVVVAQSLSHVRLFATPWTAALQAFLSFTNSQTNSKKRFQMHVTKVSGASSDKFKSKFRSQFS